MEDIVELGGNIRLNGFSSIDGASMIILKKIIGNFAKQVSEKLPNFEKLSITIEPEGKFSAEVINEGNSITANVEDPNLFIALDKVLKEIDSKI